MPNQEKPRSLLKRVRANCIECSGGAMKEVKNCHITDCMFYEFRMGTNPFRKGIGRKKNLISTVDIN